MERPELITALARTTGPVVVIFVLLGWFLEHSGRMSARGAVWVMALGIPVGLLAGLGVWYLTHASSTSLVQVITGAGNLRPTEGFSYQEALVARGKLEEARLAYLDHLRQDPGDVNARLALARLFNEHLKSPEQAEREYLEARGQQPSAEQEFVIGNGLIDLYRAQGQRGKEMAELARFSERFAGTDAGERARRALRELKTTH